MVEQALRSGLRFRTHGTYALQAAIAAVHAQAAKAEDTDWRQIAELYRLLLHEHPSPVIELNLAAAVGMADGPDAGLRLLDELQGRGELEGYYLLPAARADLLRRACRWEQAAESYRAAMTLAKNGQERQYLSRRLAEVEANLTIKP